MVEWELDLWYELWDRAGSQGLDTWYEPRRAGEERQVLPTPSGEVGDGVREPEET